MTPLERARAFCDRFDLTVPILLAPMAGATPPTLAIAVARAGGMGAGGMLTSSPDAIRAWAEEVRAGGNGAFQMNLWIPDPPPARDAESEVRMRAFLAGWGPEVPASAGDPAHTAFEAQCVAMVDSGAPVVSSIMGLFPPAFVERLKARGAAWFATCTTLAEAREATAAGADVIVAQGGEAGGHRGAFDAAAAEARLVGLFALVPAIVDAINLPVVATGGIADGRGVAAALTLGASAVQIGTAFLRSPEAGIPAAWADALAKAAPEDTRLTRAFTGRAGRSLATEFVRAAADGPSPAPWPVQAGLTGAMRAAARREGDLARLSAWAGQSAALARAQPAGQIVRDIWAEAQALLGN